MFMHPQPIDGSTADPTEGRGWADADGPDSPFLRSSKRWSERIRHMLAAQDARVLPNTQFDKVNLTAEEELWMELQKTPEDVGRDAALWGAEQARERRNRLLGPVIALMAQNGGPTTP